VNSKGPSIIVGGIIINIFSVLLAIGFDKFIIKMSIPKNGI